MAQVIQCPDCDKQLQVPEDLLGKDVQCPACKHTFVAAVPEPVSNPEPPAKETAKRDDPPIRKRARAGTDQKPGKVQAIALLSLFGGIFAVLWAIASGLFTSGGCCLWPGTYYSMVLGIMAIVRASSLLSGNAYREKLPTGLAIMHMVNIINGDVPNLVIGIIIMLFCNDDEVREYFAK